MDYSNGKSERVLEVLVWSIAFPGFGQSLNRQYVKGMAFLILEVMINVKGNVNAVIIYSFLFKTAQAIAETNYE
ncbi:MAG TPA: hypothetical protein VK029_08510 [Pseudogracilibacillus sp.]|nr:hypothetical protein [Pseudogracilibacillus sp.]